MRRGDAADGIVRRRAKLLRRAVRNLLENARRYGAGRSRSKLRREAPTLLLVRSATAGPGVPPAQRERIFEPFYRLPGASEREGGVGLGLALVQSIAARHGGTRALRRRATAAAPASSSRCRAATRVPLPAQRTRRACEPQPRIAAMQRADGVRYAAAFWGAAVFTPVGVTWAAFFVLLLALLLAGGRRERWGRVRASVLWWPMVAYVAWTLLVLALRPHYPETPSNLVHGLRIALTVAMALALTRREALWGLRAFVAMALLNMMFIGVYYLLQWRWGIQLPLPELWRGVILLLGNKSISNALLFTMLGAAAAALGLALLAAHRPGRALGAFALTAVTVIIITTNLPSRTSLLALLVVLPAICLHQWRRRWRPLVLALVLGGGVLTLAAWQAPWVGQKIALGVSEIEAADAGAVSEGSWVVRYYMYTETARMISERPLAGWGIGAWNTEWRRRGPPLLANYNMPHNDYLWMGSQAGLPGSLTLLAIILAAVRQAWKRPDLTGRIAFAALLILLLATGVNSALRDAQIGLAILWVAMLALRVSLEPGGAALPGLPLRTADDGKVPAGAR